MTERNYQGVQIATGQRASPNAPGPVRAPGKQASTQQSIAAQALEGLLGLGAAVGKQAISNKAEATYIEGVRAAALGVSLDDLDNDAMAKPFARGGYNMQTYRMEQAQLASEMDAFIKGAGKDLEPEDFAKVLAEKSSKFSGVSDKLSQADRVRGLTSQAELEQSIISAQGKAYRQEVIRRGTQQFVIQGNQINAALTQAKLDGNPEKYEAEAIRSAQFVADVMSSDVLADPALKAEATKNYLDALLAGDHHEVVDALIDTGALDNLPHDQRAKIDDSVRASKTRTRAADNLAYHEYLGNFLARLSAGDVPNIAEVRDTVEDGIRRKAITSDQAESIYKQWYGTLSDKTTTAAIITAVNAKDVGKLNALGTTPNDALVLQDQQYAMLGVPPEVRIPLMIGQGLGLGTIPKEAGQHVANAVSAVAAAEGELPASQVNLLNEVIGTVEQLGGYNSPASAILLASIPEEQSNAVAYAIGAAKHGVPPAQAIKVYTAKTAEYKALKEGAQLELKGERLAMAQDTLIGTFGNSWSSTVKRFFGSSALPNAGAWNESTALMHLQNEVRSLAHNPDNIALFAGTEDANEALMARAVGNLEKRVVRVAPSQGSKDVIPLVLPQGVSFAATFKVPEQYRARVGQILHEQYKPRSSDNFAAFQFDTTSGKLMFLETAPDGVVLQRTPVDTAGIASQINTQRQDIIDKNHKANFGDAVAIPLPDGTLLEGVPVDGDNTVGIARLDTLEWKKDLLGQMVADGRFPLQEGASSGSVGKLLSQGADVLLRAANKESRKMGVEADGPKLAIATAMYQMGEHTGYADFAKTVPGVAAAIQDKDWGGFQRAVQDTGLAGESAAAFVEGMREHFGVSEEPAPDVVPPPETTPPQGPNDTRTVQVARGKEGPAVPFQISGANTVGLASGAVAEWKENLLRHEALRLTVYPDSTSEKYATVGVGQLVDGRLVKEGGRVLSIGDTITVEEAQAMFDKSADAAMVEAVRLAPDLGITNEASKLALASVLFQMGVGRWGGFTKTKQAIRDRDWEKFQREAKDSFWYLGKNPDGTKAKGGGGAGATPKRVLDFIEGMRPHFNK